MIVKMKLVVFKEKSSFVKNLKNVLMEKNGFLKPKNRSIWTKWDWSKSELKIMPTVAEYKYVLCFIQLIYDFLE